MYNESPVQACPCSVIPDVPPLSFPTFVIGNPIGNPARDINDKAQDPGFPLTAGGNDSKERPGIPW